MYRVLIVDDEETIVKGLQRLMPWEKYGCEVVATAGDGKTGLELCHRFRPDILFTDIRMPGMDGLGLIAALRSEFPEMQVAILSGYSEFDYAQKAIRLGVCRYLVKPSRMHELEEALAGMVALLEEPPPQAPHPAQSAEKPQPLPPNAEEEADPAPDDAASNFIIKNAVKYIEENYAEKLTLPIVAEQVYVSQWHLSKLIAKTTGQNFSDLLNGVRIDRAKQLLRQPGCKIWQVSEQVGFSDVGHFSRIFKKLVDVSPNDYRAAHGGGSGD